MAARYILGCLSVVFLVAAAVRVARERAVGPAARTWLIIGMIFGAVSLWTWLSAPV
jgi:hypothetical protein